MDAAYSPAARAIIAGASVNIRCPVAVAHVVIHIHVIENPPDGAHVDEREGANEVNVIKSGKNKRGEKGRLSSTCTLVYTVE